MWLISRSLGSSTAPLWATSARPQLPAGSQLREGGTLPGRAPFLGERRLLGAILRLFYWVPFLRELYW